MKNNLCDTLGAICHGLLKNSHAPAEDRTGDPSIYSPALYHVAIKAGFYSDVVECSPQDRKVPSSILSWDIESF